ncbi:hypothetical protein D9M73_210010 [compost metagenome]
MPRAHLPGAFAEGDDHVQVDCAKGRLRSGLLDGGAQAAEGDVDAACQLWEEHRRVTHRVFQVWVFGQWATGWGQYAADGGLVEQPIK